MGDDDVRIDEFEMEGSTFAVISTSEETPGPELDVLTGAEREVARMLADGHSHEAIAEHRGTSVRTVANQIRSIYGKLGVSTRLELAHRLAFWITPSAKGAEPTPRGWRRRASPARSGRDRKPSSE